MKRLVSRPERSSFPPHGRAVGSSTTVHTIISVDQTINEARGEIGPDKVLGRNCDSVVVYRGYF